MEILPFSQTCICKFRCSSKRVYASFAEHQHLDMQISVFVSIYSTVRPAHYLLSNNTCPNQRAILNIFPASTQPPCWGMWARRSLWARVEYFSRSPPRLWHGFLTVVVGSTVAVCSQGVFFKVAPLVGACVAGCRCGLDGRYGLAGSIFQLSPLGWGMCWLSLWAGRSLCVRR